MGWWSYEREALVNATLVDAWHYFSDLDGVVEWNENLVSHDVVKGPPDEVGSIVELHYDHAGKKSSTTVTTLQRQDLRMIEQQYVSEGNESFGTARFESADFDTTKINMEIRFDMSNFSVFTRPLRKSLVKVMARDMLTRFDDFLTERRMADMAATIKEDWE